jgi:hypothetical protein
MTIIKTDGIHDGPHPVTFERDKGRVAAAENAATQLRKPWPSRSSMQAVTDSCCIVRMGCRPPPARSVPC